MRALEGDGEVTLTVVGRLDYVKHKLVRRSSEGFSFSGGFGHLSMCSRQIVIEHVEDPEATSGKRPGPRWRVA